MAAKRPPPMSAYGGNNQGNQQQPGAGPSSAPAYMPGPLPVRPQFNGNNQQHRVMMPPPGQQFARPYGPVRPPPQKKPLYRAGTDGIQAQNGGNQVDPRRAFKQLPPPHRSYSQRNRSAPTWDDDSEGSGTANEDGPTGAKLLKNPNVPDRSYALLEDKGVRTNLGNTSFVMAILSEMWILNLIVLCGGTYCMTFLLPTSYTGYVDDELWNFSCWWKIGNFSLI